MSEADIADTIDAFARAAMGAERLGFDGIAPALMNSSAL
jgi:2,4-dienoyl-CoA reductase-like NADH-dependent reductase (Old Yellow Enzyme family)